jgi:hypothetical protein
MRSKPIFNALTSHSGVSFTVAELAKRKIIADVIGMRNFPLVDVSIGTEDASPSGYVQVKACSYDRSRTFALTTTGILSWIGQPESKFVAFVWLGNEGKAPTYWLTTMNEAGLWFGPGVREYQRRKHRERIQYWVAPDEEIGFTKGRTYARLNRDWRGNWEIFDKFKCRQ